MHSSNNFEQRLRKLEQVRTGIQVMHILFGSAAHDHYGIFRVTTGGGRVRYEQRLPDETWNDFQKRMDEFVTGILKIATFMPVDSEGNDLLYDDIPERYLQ